MSSTQDSFNPFKTAMCRDAKNCKFGKECRWAHSIAELRKTKMCRYVGRCTNKQCTFAHKASELAVNDTKKVQVLKRTVAKVPVPVKSRKLPSATMLFDSESDTEPDEADKVLMVSETETDDDLDISNLGYDEVLGLYTKYMSDHDLDDNLWGDQSVAPPKYAEWRGDICIQTPIC